MAAAYALQCCWSPSTEGRTMKPKPELSAASPERHPEQGGGGRGAAQKTKGGGRDPQEGRGAAVNIPSASMHRACLKS